MTAICKLVRPYSRPSSQARLRIGRAIQQLEQDHHDYFTRRFHLSPDMYDADLKFTTPMFTVSGLSNYSLALAILRRVLYWKWTLSHGHIRLEVKDKWQLGDTAISMKWEVVAPSPSSLSFRVVQWLTFGSPGLFRMVYGGRARAVPSALTLLSGYSHYQFSPLTGSVTEHVVDQTVPPPPALLTRALLLIFPQRAKEINVL